MIAWMLLAAVANGASSATMAEVFTHFCTTGDPVASILDRAASEGWKSDRVGAPPGFDPATARYRAGPDGTLVLSANEGVTAGERQQACGVRVAQARPDIGSVVETMLGGAPAFSMAGSTTSFGTHDADGWHYAGHLPHAAFVTAKARGAFYSVMTTANPDSAQIYSLNARPADDAKP